DAPSSTRAPAHGTALAGRRWCDRRLRTPLAYAGIRRSRPVSRAGSPSSVFVAFLSRPESTTMNGALRTLANFATKCDNQSLKRLTAKQRGSAHFMRVSLIGGWGQKCGRPEDR